MNSIPSNKNVQTPTVTTIERNDFQKMLEQDMDELFFNTDEFAINITYHHSRDNTSQTIPALFDNDFDTIGMDGLEVMAGHPRILIKAKSIHPQPVEGDQVIVEGLRYNVFGVPGTNLGMTEIYLKRA